MSRLGFGIAGLATLLVWSGCSDNAATYPGGEDAGASGHSSAGHAGSAGASAGATNAGATNAGNGGTGNSAGADSSNAGEGGASEAGGSAGGSAGEGGSNDQASAGAAGVSGEPVVCGPSLNVKCPSGQFCELASACGPSGNTFGVCAPFGKIDDCDDVAGPDGPECGCEGKFYTNTCQRRAFGMLEAPSGTCSGIATYPTAYGVWQVSQGGAPGPAVVVNASLFARTWDSVASFPAETPPTKPTGSIPLTREDSDDLFLRLAGLPFEMLPHAGASTAGCHAEFYFRLCDGCGFRSVSYDGSAQVMDEMSLAWDWFDRVIGADSPANPKNFCK